MYRSSSSLELGSGIPFGKGYPTWSYWLPAWTHSAQQWSSLEQQVWQLPRKPSSRQRRQILQSWGTTQTAEPETPWLVSLPLHRLIFLSLISKFAARNGSLHPPLKSLAISALSDVVFCIIVRDAWNCCVCFMPRFFCVLHNLNQCRSQVCFLLWRKDQKASWEYLGLS